MSTFASFSHADITSKRSGDTHAKWSGSWAVCCTEMGCDGLLKATQVDGVYSADPETTPNATRYDQLTYDDVLRQDLRIMDGAAIALARDNRIPIIVFSIKAKCGLADVLQGRGASTKVAAKA